MSAPQVDPHDKMRARDVNKVARGEQAPRPAHEYSSIKQTPPMPTSSKRNNNDGDNYNNNNNDYDDEINKMVEPGTAPVDTRFPCTNQTRHCYARYIEYQKCIQKKGKNVPECEKFAKYYRSLCPTEWIARWNEEIENGIFPGPI